MIDHYMSPAPNNPKFSILLCPMTHQVKEQTFIAVFVSTTGAKRVSCILFHRQSGDCLTCDVIQTQLMFEPPKDAYWDDEYTIMRTANKDGTPVPSWALRSMPPRTLEPKDSDNLFNFSIKDSSLVSNQHSVIANTTARFIAGQCNRLKKTLRCAEAVVFLNHQPRNGEALCDVINLIGATTHCVRISIAADQVMSFRPATITRMKRRTEELELGASLWDGMSGQELTEFTESEFANILHQVEITKTSNTTTSLPPSTTRNLNSEEDGERCQTWMRFVRSQLAPKTYMGMNFVTIKLLHIPSAWSMFDTQILQMRYADTPIYPRIMFHGVRGDNPSANVESICKSGFNHKHTTTCVYGAGGTYCSPQFACAFEYTSNAKDNQKFVFVCMVVPGKVCDKGLDSQQMAPDQNSWTHVLENGHQIYCSETIVPFALLTFVP